MSISEFFCQEGIPYYRGQDIHNFFIERTNPICIPDVIYKQSTMQRSHLRKGDVLLSIVGTIGEVSILNNCNPATCSCKLAILRPNNDMTSEIIALFLKTKYGQNQIKKYVRGAVQMGFILDDVDQILIPQFKRDLQNHITTLVSSAYDALSTSESLLKRAELELLRNIGFEGCHPEQKSYNIKQLKESFLATGRLDAEYYSKKYASYSDLIKSYKNGYGTLPQVCNLENQNYSPVRDKVYKYIELSNIGTLGDIKGFSQIIGAELPSRARRIVHTGDVIISSIEGSLQSIALVDEDNDSALCSTGFYVIKPKQINSETLLVLFKSELMQNLLKQQCSGTILTSINYDDLRNIIVPIIDESVQKNIADYVQKSVSLRQKAKQLLEDAKTLVEQEIESR